MFSLLLSFHNAWQALYDAGKRLKCCRLITVIRKVEMKSIGDFSSMVWVLWMIMMYWWMIDNMRMLVVVVVVVIHRLLLLLLPQFRCFGRYSMMRHNLATFLHPCRYFDRWAIHHRCFVGLLVSLEKEWSEMASQCKWVVIHLPRG